MSGSYENYIRYLAKSTAYDLLEREEHVTNGKIVLNKNNLNYLNSLDYFYWTIKIKIKLQFSPPKWLLYIGISLWLLSTFALGLFFSEYNSSEQPIYAFLNALPYYSMLILGALMVPIIEEIAFRGWLRPQRWLKVLSLILIMGYIYFLVQNIWLCIPLEILIAYLMFSRPNHQKRIIAIIVISLIFGCSHWGNYDDTCINILGVTATMGMGIVLSWLTWRYHLIWAILLHIMNNALAFASSDFENRQHHHIQDVSSNVHYTIEFHADPLPFHSDESFFTTDSISYQGLLRNFTSLYFDQYFQENDVILHADQSIKTGHIKISMHFKDTSDGTYYAKALNEVLERNKYTLDTILMPTYHLDFSQYSEGFTFYPSEENDNAATLALNVMKDIWQSNFGIPIKKMNTDSLFTITFPLRSRQPIHENSDKVRFSFHTPDFFQIMADNDIKLTVDSTQMLPVIKLRKK